MADDNVTPIERRSGSTSLDEIVRGVARERKHAEKIATLNMLLNQQVRRATYAEGKQAGLLLALEVNAKYYRPSMIERLWRWCRS